MSPEKWEELKGRLLDHFSDAQLSHEVLEDPERGEKEILEFVSLMGRIKLEYITKPVVIDKKTHGSRRIGSHTEVEYVYSQTESSHALKAYKWDGDEGMWVEIDLKGGVFSL